MSAPNYPKTPLVLSETGESEQTFGASPVTPEDVVFVASGTGTTTPRLLVYRRSDLQLIRAVSLDAGLAVMAIETDANSVYVVMREPDGSDLTGDVTVVKLRWTDLQEMDRFTFSELALPAMDRYFGTADGFQFVIQGMELVFMYRTSPGEFRSARVGKTKPHKILDLQPWDGTAIAGDVWLLWGEELYCARTGATSLTISKCSDPATVLASYVGTMGAGLPGGWSTPPVVKSMAVVGDYLYVEIVGDPDELCRVLVLNRSDMTSAVVGPDGYDGLFGLYGFGNTGGACFDSDCFYMLAVDESGPALGAYSLADGTLVMRATVLDDDNTDCFWPPAAFRRTAYAELPNNPILYEGDLTSGGVAVTPDQENPVRKPFYLGAVISGSTVLNAGLTPIEFYRGLVQSGAGVVGAAILAAKYYLVNAIQGGSTVSGRVVHALTGLLTGGSTVSGSIVQWIVTRFGISGGSTVSGSIGRVYRGLLTGGSTVRGEFRGPGTMMGGLITAGSGVVGAEIVYGRIGAPWANLEPDADFCIEGELEADNG